MFQPPSARQYRPVSLVRRDMLTQRSTIGVVSSAVVVRTVGKIASVGQVRAERDGMFLEWRILGGISGKLLFHCDCST